MKIAELFAELGFQINSGEQAKVKDMINLLGEVNLKSALAATGLGGAALAIADLAEKTAGYATSLQTFSTITGLSTDEIQKWEQAVERAGGTADDARNSLKGVQDYLLRLKLGLEDGNYAMSAFGISATDGPIEALKKMAKVLKENGDPALKTFLAGQMNISQGMQNLLQNTKNLDAELDNSRIMNPNDIKEMVAFYHEMTLAFQTLGATGRQLAIDFGPLLKIFLALLDTLLLIVDLALVAENNVRKLVGGAIGALPFGKQAIDFVTGSHYAQPGGNKNTTNNVNINVHGANDPHAVGKSVNDRLRQWLNDVSAQSASPVT